MTSISPELSLLAGAGFDAFFGHAPEGFGLLDQNLRHLRVNRALAAVMELEPGDIEGHTLAEFAPVHGTMLEPLARRVLDTGEPVIGIEVAGANGRHHLVSYYPIHGAAGTVGLGTAVTEVTYLKDVERRLEETNRRLTVLATTDELTGLPNRRMLGEQLELALARARRGGLAVAVLCLDIDRFKEVNDTLGHGYGDQLLVQFAVQLRSGARETDVVSRIGGDEFVIVLADLDPTAAEEIAEAVIKRIRARFLDPIAIDAVELLVDTSIGVAMYPTDSLDAKGLLAAADAAMYLGKNVLAPLV